MKPMANLLLPAMGFCPQSTTKADTMNIPEKLKARFWAKVSLRQDSDCWRWDASKDLKGYGQINTGGMLETNRAHRLSYILHYGSIADGMLVCHACDNPECTNPDHLFLGTPKDNTQDMLSKDREASGMRSGSRKLNQTQVVSIRRMYADGNSIDSLMGEFKVSRACITDIITGRRWGKAPGPISKLPGKAKKLTAEIVVEIYKAIGRGDSSYVELGEMYRVSDSTIRNIGEHKIWQHVTDSLPAIYHEQIKQRTSLNQVIDAHTALEIRRLRNDVGWPTKKVASHLKINEGIVRDVSLGKSWKTIGGTIRKTGPGKKGQHLGSARSNAKMNEAKVKELRALHSQGWKNAQLQARFSLSAATVSNIANRKTWKHVD